MNTRSLKKKRGDYLIEKMLSAKDTSKHIIPRTVKTELTLIFVIGLSKAPWNEAEALKINPNMKKL